MDITLKNAKTSITLIRTNMGTAIFVMLAVLDNVQLGKAAIQGRVAQYFAVSHVAVIVVFTAVIIGVVVAVIVVVPVVVVAIMSVVIIVNVVLSL